MSNLLIVCQKYIIETLSTNSEFKKNSNGVFIYTPQNIAFPYVHISKIKTKDWSSKTEIGQIIFYSFTIYTHQNSIVELTNISNCLYKILNNKFFETNEFKISSIKFLNSEITHKNNGTAFQMTCEYKLYIMEKKI
ncbi:MAG: hypothetical protein J0H68_08010 [Sphingobacteriia bacterium]|nr:hypothetical protein [Sphingobacteriia bacterium]